MCSVCSVLFWGSGGGGGGELGSFVCLFVWGGVGIIGILITNGKICRIMCKGERGQRVGP